MVEMMRLCCHGDSMPDAFGPASSHADCRSALAAFGLDPVALGLNRVPARSISIHRRKKLDKQALNF